MATNPVEPHDPIAAELREILAAHPELHERFDRLERQIADGTFSGYSDEEVADLLGFQEILEETR